MTTGLRAWQIIKAAGIKAEVGNMFIKGTAFDVAYWKWDGIEYASTCNVYQQKWTFKILNIHLSEWRKYEFNNRTQLMTWFVDKFKAPVASLGGIYGYFDSVGRCVYIGKDTHIYSLTRDYQHRNNPTSSPIDQALQLNGHLRYRELFRFDDEETMNRIEVELIKLLKPKYNVQHNKGGNNA